ncbi:MAG: hypothetical protein ABIE74_12700 [Pseudomonadota bacterium]
MARLVKLKDADDSFDLEFWQKVGVAGIFAAMWEMVYEYHKSKGDYDRSPRLQRHVEVLKRR